MSKGKRARIGRYTEALNSRNTLSEVAVATLLKENKIFGFHTNLKFGSYYPDFIHLDLKIIIEADGSYHLKNIQKNRDSRKDRFYDRCGYKVFRIIYPFSENISEQILEIKKTYKERNNQLQSWILDKKYGYKTKKPLVKRWPKKAKPLEPPRVMKVILRKSVI